MYTSTFDSKTKKSLMYLTRIYVDPWFWSYEIINVWRRVYQSTVDFVAKNWLMSERIPVA